MCVCVYHVYDAQYGWVVKKYGLEKNQKLTVLPPGGKGEGERIRKSLLRRKTKVIIIYVVYIIIIGGRRWKEYTLVPIPCLTCDLNFFYRWTAINYVRDEVGQLKTLFIDNLGIAIVCVCIG